MKSQCARFLTGDAKGLLHESARAKDIFIISDPYNCSVTYDIRGHTNHMSPDDHFMNVKRIISAIDGKARRVSVMMNMLYGSRQDGRNSRESLDCAIGLRELENSGVKNIITFDAHEPKVQNAVPYTSFDNLYPSYQMLKALLRNETGINLSRDETLIVSPDAGGVKRCIHFAKTLGLEIGMFYKQRDTLSTEGGTAPIERHEYIGSDIAGRDVIIVEDIIASGESMINSFYKLKEAGARKIFAFITFGMFTKGYGEFDKAYADGIFNRMFATNLTYRYKDKEDRAYLCDVDLSKYAAYVIDCIYKEKAISDVVDPEAKIRRLMLSSGGRS
jgi:ribose-phosphate pyrophosphokinase